MIDRALQALKPKSLVRVVGKREPTLTGKVLVYLRCLRDHTTGRIYGEFRPQYEEDSASGAELHYFWANEVDPEP